MLPNASPKCFLCFLELCLHFIPSELWLLTLHPLPHLLSFLPTSHFLPLEANRTSSMRTSDPLSPPSSHHVLSLRLHFSPCPWVTFLPWDSASEVTCSVQTDLADDAGLSNFKYRTTQLWITLSLTLTYVSFLFKIWQKCFHLLLSQLTESNRTRTALSSLETVCHIKCVHVGNENKWICKVGEWKF